MFLMNFKDDEHQNAIYLFLLVLKVATDDAFANRQNKQRVLWWVILVSVRRSFAIC